jgi:dTDP-4-dehydrorhamnose reductase
MNVVATQNVVDLANATGSHVVTFSTDYVFDGKKGNEYEEDDLPAPLNYYGETKRSAEEYVQKNCTRYTLCRISWLFGMYGTSFPRTILEKAGQVKSFEIVADQVGRPTYTKDLAEALKRVFLNEKNDRILYQQIFHLGNSGYSSWAEYAEFVLKCSNGVRPEVKSISTPANHRPAERPKFSVLALEKSKRILGVHMRPWKEAVEEFVHEYEKS